jgi:hypothetical protein
MRRPLGSVDEPVFTKLYARLATPAFALVTLRDAIFLSLAEDGRKLATFAFSRLPRGQGLRKHVAIDACAASYTEQWQRHERELAAQQEFAGRDASADELIVEWAESARRETEHLLERGGFVRCADGRLRLGLRTALRVALRSPTGSPRVPPRALALAAAAVLVLAVALPLAFGSRRPAEPPATGPVPVATPAGRRARTPAPESRWSRAAGDARRGSRRRRPAPTRSPSGRSRPAAPARQLARASGLKRRRGPFAARSAISSRRRSARSRVRSRAPRSPVLESAEAEGARTAAIVRQLR